MRNALAMAAAALIIFATGYLLAVMWIGVSGLYGLDEGWAVGIMSHWRIVAKACGYVRQ